MFSSGAEMKVRIGTFALSNSFTNKVQILGAKKTTACFFYKIHKYFFAFCF